MAAAVVAAPKAVAAKVEDPLVEAKGMVVGGLVEQATRLAEGAAMHLQAVGKSKSGSGLA